MTGGGSYEIVRCFASGDAIEVDTVDKFANQIVHDTSEFVNPVLERDVRMKTLLHFLIEALAQ